MTTTVFDLADREPEAPAPAVAIGTLAMEWRQLDARIKEDTRRRREVERAIDAFADTACAPKPVPFPRTIIPLPNTAIPSGASAVVYSNRHGFKYDSHKVQEMIKTGVLPPNLPFSLSMNERAFEKLPAAVRDALGLARTGTFSRSLNSVVTAGEKLEAEAEDEE